MHGPVSGAGFDQERRDMFESLSFLLGQLPFRSLWVVGGDFNAEIGFKGVGEEGTLGAFAHGHQMMEWAQGEGLRFLLSQPSQRCRDPWFHPKSLRGHLIDHLLCRERDHIFLGSSKVLFEDNLGTPWSAYADRHPVEVKLAKGWVFRAPPKPFRRLRRPNCAALRGSSDAAMTARSALAVEMDRRATAEQPSSWQNVVELRVGVPCVR